jgi:hypothetical protein
MEHPEGPRAPEPTAASVHDGGSGLPALLEADYKAQRWQLVRDLAVFQAKLIVDGIKDLVLSPVALVAALAGLVFDRRDPGRSFYELLRWGHGFDRWVNLFGASQRGLPPAAEPQASGLATGSSVSPSPAASPSSSDGLDAYVTKLERVLVDQYRRGGLTAKAKDAIDHAIDGLQTRDKRPPS